jgi:hypothetical protein
MRCPCIHPYVPVYSTLMYVKIRRPLISGLSGYIRVLVTCVYAWRHAHMNERISLHLGEPPLRQTHAALPYLASAQIAPTRFFVVRPWTKPAPRLQITARRLPQVTILYTHLTAFVHTTRLCLYCHRIPAHVSQASSKWATALQRCLPTGTYAMVVSSWFRQPECSPLAHRRDLPIC